jgi:uncharacterized protein (TIGR03435 family)
LDFAQDVPAKEEFEVATVKPSVPPTRRVGCSSGPGFADPTLLRCEQMSLRNLILWAYDIKVYQLAGPEWLKNQVFDISARVPARTTQVQLAGMLRNLLIERFGLETHRESKELMQYDLVVAKYGPKFKETAAESPALQPETYHAELAKDGYPVLEPGHSGILIQKGRGRLYLTGWTMEKLAAEIRNELGAPVADATGLKGKYDIGLFWVVRQGLGAQPSTDGGGTDGPSLPQALQEQLGLRLEARKGQVEVLVIDHADKMPTGN